MRSVVSNSRQPAVWGTVVSWLCAGLFCVTATTGCASGPRAADTEENKQKKKREPQAPNPEALANSPCGNPEWGSLPKEHEIDGDPAPSENGDTDTGEAGTDGGSDTEAATDDVDANDDSADDKQNERGDE